MKKSILILAIALLALSSCTKCYECTTNVTTYATGQPASTASANSTICGTQEEMSAVTGTRTSRAVSGGVTVTQIETTSCK